MRNPQILLNQELDFVNNVMHRRKMKRKRTEPERKKRMVKSPVCKVSKDKQDEKVQRRSTRISQKNFKNMLIHRL